MCCLLIDVDIYNIYEQYESLVDNFKTVHRESEAIENSGVNINELRSDLTAMENERDIVIKRLEQMSRKVNEIYIDKYQIEIDLYIKNILNLTKSDFSIGV